MNFRLLPPAKLELKAAARFYQERAPGLGLEFIAVMHLHRHPDSWRKNLP